eukprot:350388-Chlamydomonas_euryale.AAC.20
MNEKQLGVRKKRSLRGVLQTSVCTLQALAPFIFRSKPHSNCHAPAWIPCNAPVLLFSPRQQHAEASESESGGDAEVACRCTGSNHARAALRRAASMCRPTCLIFRLTRALPGPSTKARPECSALADGSGRRRSARSHRFASHRPPRGCSETSTRGGSDATRHRP